MAKRWEERISDLENAINRLEEAINDNKQYKIESLKDAAIQRFEFSLELSWKAIKKYLNSEGVLEATTPKQTIKEAFSKGMLDNAKLWINMLNDRNLTSHTYSQNMADEIYKKISESYFYEMKSVFEMLSKKEVDE